MMQPLPPSAGVRTVQSWLFFITGASRFFPAAKEYDSVCLSLSTTRSMTWIGMGGPSLEPFFLVTIKYVSLTHSRLTASLVMVAGDLSKSRVWSTEVCTASSESCKTSTEEAPQPIANKVVRVCARATRISSRSLLIQTLYQI